MIRNKAVKIWTEASEKNLLFFTAFFRLLKNVKPFFCIICIFMSVPLCKLNRIKDDLNFWFIGPYNYSVFDNIHTVLLQIWSTVLAFLWHNAQPVPQQN